MFRPTSGHPQVHNWSVKRVEEEILIKQVHEKQLYLLILLKIVNVISRNDVCVCVCVWISEINYVNNICIICDRILIYTYCSCLWR